MALHRVHVKTMNDGLSNSKRKYIENWRQNVSIFMESGNICRTTTAEVTPEPHAPLVPQFIKTVPGEPNNNGMDKLRLEDFGSPILPAVKFSYCHADDDITKQERRQKQDLYRGKRTPVKPTTLPPSPPNGVIVQNGMDVPSQKRRTVLKSVENKLHESDMHDVYLNSTDQGTRKSTRTAREIYEKYNMKSKTQNMLMNSPAEHSVYSMPWRNKTFLSLPLRFNGNIPRKQHSASRPQGGHADISHEDFSDTDDVRFTREWTDIGF